MIINNKIPVMKNKLLHILNDLFSLIFLLLFIIAVKPELIYHYQQLGFSTAKTFFSEFSSYPGGIVEYISLYLFQFYTKAFWGALVSTIVLASILTMAGEIVKKGNSLINGILRLLPVVLLGILFTDYTIHPVFPVMVLFLFIFFFLFKLVADSKLSVAVQLVLNLIIFSIAYYITGGYIFMILSGSAVIYLLFTNRKNWLFSAALITALFLVLPYLAQSVFFINSKDAYFKLVPYFFIYKPGFFLYGALFSLPFILLIHQVITKLNNQKADENNSFIHSDKFQAFQVVFMILVFAIVFLLNIDSQKRHKIDIDYLASQQKWDDLLKLTEKETSNDRLIQFQISRALYHTGELTEKLFDYPQNWGADGLLLTRYFEEIILIPTTELYFDFGYINEAFHYANEAISLKEDSPLLLEQLILANLVANKYPAAQIYINVLKNNPFFKNKALKYEQYINGKGLPEIGNLIAEKRKLMPVTDFAVNKKLPQDELLFLLTDRPENKMIYEYLMTFFLLENDIPSFFKYYSLGKNFGYKKLPKVFQEALILYMYDLSRQGKKMGNIRFDKEIATQFSEYLSILKTYNGDIAQARPLLEKKFGNTYWFYIHYTSPVTNKTKIVTE
jgi:hypothetical protein